MTPRPQSSLPARERAAEASATFLAMLISPENAFVDDPETGGVRFRCPRCQMVDHNGGSAFVTDWWNWRCINPACGAVGTRFELEHAVLYDSEALFSLMMRPR